MSTVASEPVLVDKGLKRDSVGLLASVVLALSSVAPAYALTATLGPTVGEVGAQMPATFLVGFVPMLLVAYAYRRLNQVAPDAGHARSRGRPRRSARTWAGCAAGAC